MTSTTGSHIMLVFLTTHKAAWYITSVDSVCMSVCLSDDHFWKPCRDVKLGFFLNLSLSRDNQLLTDHRPAAENCRSDCVDLAGVDRNSVVTVWLFSRSLGVDRCFNEKVRDRFLFECLYTCTKYHMVSPNTQELPGCGYTRSCQERRCREDSIKIAVD